MKAAQKSTPKIPDGMVELMKNLVKNVLKEQPDNIYLFAAEYFENLVLQRDGTLDKEYSVFRKYEEELEKRRDKEGCSRCRRLVNVEDNANDDFPKQVEVENAGDMSVSGVAIKAVPRHYKPLKSQKSKQHLETIKSESMDSAIEDDGKSISAESHDNKDAVVQQIRTENTDTLQKNMQNLSPAVSLGPSNEVNGEEIAPIEKIPTEKIIQPLIEEIIEPISARKLVSDQDVPPDTPTNETSISDTDRTVIENAVLIIDTNQNDDLNPFEHDTEEINSTDNKQIDTSTKIQLLTDTPKTELSNLQNSDRIRTPESDSGLSEKSFNLNIHEDTTANEMYKAEPIKEDCTEEKLIPLDTSRSSGMEKEEDENMDDGQTNKSDVEKLESDPDENEQTQTEEKENEKKEEHKEEIERVRSSDDQNPINDQSSADPQESIANDVSENHEKQDEPLFESNDLENKKIEEESNSIDNDQTADSTEKPIIPIENKVDEQISPNEETDSKSTELKLIKENEVPPKTIGSEALQTKFSSDKVETIELNEPKSTDAIFEEKTSEMCEKPIENCSENMKIHETTDGKPVEFEKSTDCQPIVDESNENSNEKTENNSDGVKIAESNGKESIITENTLNDPESSKDMDSSPDQVDSKWDTTTDQDGNQIKLCSNQLTDDQTPELIHDSHSDLEPTKIDTNNSEECQEKLSSNDSEPIEPSEKADIINKATESLNAKDSVEDSESINERDEPMKEGSVNNESNDPITEISNVEKSGAENEIVPLKLDPEETIISNELKGVENNIDDFPETNLPKKDELSGTETVLEAAEKDSKQLNSSPRTPKNESNESSLEATEHAQSESVPTSTKVPSNKLEKAQTNEKPSEQLKSPPTTPKIESIESDEKVPPTRIPTSPKAERDESDSKTGKNAHSQSSLATPKAQINETATEITEKTSEQLKSLPTTTKAEGNETETVEQSQLDNTPSSPKIEMDSTEPTLDEECEKNLNKTESNDQTLSEETTKSVENEPTDSSEITIIEKKLESTTIENNELSMSKENQTEDANNSNESPSNQEPKSEDAEHNEIEMTHLEIKNNNDDAISEIGSSVKDDLYEKAETEIIGDESVQELDLSMQEKTEDISREDLTRPNTAMQLTDSPKQQDANKNDNQMQPDSLDNSLEPMGENDSLADTKSVDSLEIEKKDAKSDKCDTKTPSLEPNADNSPQAQFDEGSMQNKSAKIDDKEKDEEKNEVDPISLVESKPCRTSQDLMGDSVNDKGNNDHMNDQMKNELATLNFNQNPNASKLLLSNIEEVDTPVTPKPAASEIKFLYESDVETHNDVKLDEMKKESDQIPQIKIETVVQNGTESKESITTKLDDDVILPPQPVDQENSNKNNELSKPDTKAQNNVKTVDFLTSLRHISHDTPSSDLSDTDTEKPELVSNESCIDENSRDEHDDVSEVENFDLSSCGEDSLEAMYYMLRKNEILMDEQKKMNKCEDEKITFPEKATENLENVFREVSGKKTICSIESMNSSNDDVILKQLSSDSDALQMHILPNSEIDSSTEPKSCAMNTTDDEYLTEMNDTSSHGMVHDEMDSKMTQNNNSSTNDEQPANECDTFDDDVIQAHIERKIQAYSISEADSDEAPANAKILTKDDFNVSTALGHLRSTTEETDSFESAATKIQAGARGFLTRRRLGKSESASIEKRSSIGNAAIDKSLDNFVDRQELMQDQRNSKVENGVSRPALTIDQTIESIDDASVQGIIEVKMEQMKNEPSTSIVINENITENPILTVTGSDDSGTAQRRLTLQRGDAMQRNSTPELEQQQQQQQQQFLIEKETIDNKDPTNDEATTSPKQDEATECIQKPVHSASKLPTGKPRKTLGPRQRSMPVQFESMLMRVLPTPEQKRIKSANNSTPKKTKRRPNLF